MIIDDAVPAKHFAKPPYRGELFSKQSGWAGVINVNGINCLTFKNKPGAVISSYENCVAIAERWNNAEVNNA